MLWVTAIGVLHDDTWHHGQKEICCRTCSDDLKLLHPITVRLHLAVVDQLVFLQNNLRGCIEVKAANLYQQRARSKLSN
ncbi:hypothetical protein ES288_A10G189600v1 [Gossypium darwinii]|uniref:Uncharacterized protein n=1 Tax=Gossypium darwinii TaxID=34276 RepID=A0A5D2F0W6_GOSDA|nr:hypothetical protein ES288_A10G189600v1 [Gossypium darwinii]